jgi:sodium-dependent dicarboxylate transporter 2/3/5
VVLGELVAPSLSGKPAWLALLLVLAFLTFLGEVASNTAVATVLLPVIGQAAIAAGWSPLYFMAPAAIACSASFILPVGTPPNAIAFATRLVPATHMARIGFLIDCAFIVAATALFAIWGAGVMGIESALPAWAGAPSSR